MARSLALACCLVLIAFAADAAGATGGFAPAPGSPFSTDPLRPVGVAVGDFNGDGKPDVVAGSNVLLGDGSGALVRAPGSPFAGVTDTYALAAGDFNNDGKLDLVTADPNDELLWVFLGDGQGGFSSPQGYPRSGLGHVWELAAADFNKDGNLDVAILDGRGALVVLLGDGLGGLRRAPGGTVAVESDSQGIAIGDFDKDGDVDVAVAVTGFVGVRVCLNNGAGGLSVSCPAYGDGTGTGKIAAGDVNNDGNLDLVRTSFSENEVSWFLGDGHGAFAAGPGSPLATGRQGTDYVVTGDLNRDGNVDAAITQSGSQSVTVLLGDSAGRLAPGLGSDIPVGGLFPAGIAIADMNADGLPDLVTSNFISVDVSVLLAFPAGRNAAKTCENERAALGDDRFRAKYGTNASGANAFGQCVKRTSG